MKKLAALPLRQAAIASLCLFLNACGGDAPPTPSASSTPSASPVASYTIGGTITGLADSESMTLLDNGGDTLTLATNGAFSFATPIAFNQAYAVTVGTPPLWQNCSVANGNGTATANVTNVDVTCAAAHALASKFAGSGAVGSANGTGSAASFNGPVGVAVDASGNVYVADTFNNEIRKITPAGVVSTLAGSTTPGSADGTGSAASFNAPTSVAVDASGNVYVADFNNSEIRKITPAGVVSTLAGGTGAAASFNSPRGVAVDASGNVYVADSVSSEIRKITPAGVVSTLAGGTGAAASFNFLTGVAVDARGNVYVADDGNHEIFKITPAGVVSTLAGSTTAGSADGTGSAASFNDPAGVAVDASGNVYVADGANNEIRKITPAGVVSTLAGSTTAGSADGIGSAASFNDPVGVAIDASGNVYVADASNNEIRKIAPAP